MEIGNLLARCRQGDAAAWESLVRQFQGRVYGLALHYLGDREEARDAAQDLFVRLYERLPTCTDDETFVPWLIRMTRNLCIDTLRRRKVRPRPMETPIEEMAHLRAATPAPDEQLHKKERRELIQNALQRMSGIGREMIVLKEIQGLTLDQVAGILRIPIGTAKSRSNRARIELAHEVFRMTETEDEPPGGREA